VTLYLVLIKFTYKIPQPVTPKVYPPKRDIVPPSVSTLYWKIRAELEMSEIFEKPVLGLKNRLSRNPVSLPVRPEFSSTK
jgi:hypothetical protein